MGRIIAIANQKGGVGKTTTAINLSATLAEAGEKVLAVDFDPQGNETSGLGLEKEKIQNTVYEMLVGECDIENCLVKEIQKNLDLLPSNVNLAGAEIELLEIRNKEKLLKNYLEKVKDQYDFIIIDCPPIMLVSDAIPIGNVVDGTIFVCSSQLTGRKDAKASIEILQKNNVNILGTVLTQVEQDGSSNGYYYYY